jgi:hypothetical protein
MELGGTRRVGWFLVDAVATVACLAALVHALI